MTISQSGRTIIHVTDSFFPESGGVERVIMNLALCQRDSGNKVIVMTKGLPGLAEFEIIDRIEVYRYRHFARPTIGNYISTWSGTIGCLKKIIKKNKPDIIHGHLTLSSQGAVSLARKKGVPFVSSFYGPWDLEYLEESRSLLKTSGVLTSAHLRFLMAVQRRMQQKLLESSKSIIVLSDHSKSHVLRFSENLSKKIVKIPGGVEAKRFYPETGSGDLRKRWNIPNSTPLILTIRRLVHRMGVDVLLEAFCRLLKKRNGAVLVIGGKGPLESDLKKKALELGIEAQVHFAGYIPEGQLADAYREADVFILPTVAEENFGLPILEAAACGTPVLGTAIGSIPEVLGQINKDLLIEKANPEAIASKLDFAIENMSFLNEQFQQASNTIRHDYAWETIAGRIGLVYEDHIRC